jgi:hypothetical protein
VKLGIVASLFLSLAACRPPGSSENTIDPPPPSRPHPAGGAPEAAATSASAPPDAEPASVAAPTAPEATPPAALEAASARAQAAVRALRDRDWNALAALVDPERGVRFSPYSYVDDHDVRLTAAQLITSWRDERKRRWGSFDGTGDPIDLSFAAYYRRFLYDADFARGGPRPAGFAENTSDNASERYGAGAVIVEFYLPPSEPDGYDWRALRIALARRAETYYVVGIIHAQWTI